MGAAAERLRQAASVLRGDIEGAIAAPWGVHFGTEVSVNPTRQENGTVRHYGAVASTDVDDEHPSPEGTARFIARCDPAVAGAVVDWLDDYAGLLERVGDADRNVNNTPALRVADALLGHDEGPA